MQSSTGHVYKHSDMSHLVPPCQVYSVMEMGGYITNHSDDKSGSGLMSVISKGANICIESDKCHSWAKLSWWQITHTWQYIRLL